MNVINSFLTREYGISPELCALAEEVERQVRGEFARIDRVRDYNQLKVLRSMQKNGLAERHFNFSTGYGYNDIGRDLLDRIFADAFDCEDALVRSQFISGTHALTVALSANLLPGDELLSPVGAPYDTLQEVITFLKGQDYGQPLQYTNYR